MELDSKVEHKKNYHKNYFQEHKKEMQDCRKKNKRLISAAKLHKEGKIERYNKVIARILRDFPDIEFTGYLKEIRE